MTESRTISVDITHLVEEALHRPDPGQVALPLSDKGRIQPPRDQR